MIEHNGYKFEIKTSPTYTDHHGVKRRTVDVKLVGKPDSSNAPTLAAEASDASDVAPTRRRSRE